MFKLPCLVSLQTASRSIAVVHAILILATSCYVVYILGGLINSNEMSHVHSATGVVSTLDEYYQKLGLSKVPKAKMGEKIGEFSLGGKHNIAVDKLFETGSKTTFYSSRFVDDLKVQHEILIYILALLIFLVIFVLDVELFQGAKQRNYERVNAWYRTMFTLTIAWITLILPIVITAVENEFTWKFYAVGITKLVSIGYVLCIIGSFKEELKKEQDGYRTKKNAKKSE